MVDESAKQAGSASVDAGSAAVGDGRSSSEALQEPAIGEADIVAAGLSDQMRELKTRFRIERRKLETRTFDPDEG